MTHPNPLIDDRAVQHIRDYVKHVLSEPALVDAVVRHVHLVALEHRDHRSKELLASSAE